MNFLESKLFCLKNRCVLQKQIKLNFFNQDTLNDTPFKYKEKALKIAVKKMRANDTDATLLEQKLKKKKEEFENSRCVKDQELFTLIPFTKEARRHNISTLNVWEQNNQGNATQIKDYIDR